MCLPKKIEIERVMNRGRYLFRAFSYFVRLLVLILLALLITYLLGWLNTGGQPIYTVLISPRGAMLIGLVVILSALYPRFGFTTVEVKGDVDKNREQLLEAFKHYDYALDREEDGKLIFRANSGLKRLWAQYNDSITVHQITQHISIEGRSQMVGRVMTALEAAIERAQ